MGQENNTAKKQKWKQINERERYKIEALLDLGKTPLEVADQLGRDRRTIEREIKRGSVIQLDSQLVERKKYCADAGQRVHGERGANKGRQLKIGYDHKLAAHIEKKIGEENYSPDAVIGEIKEQGWVFQTNICTKTLYNYIDQNVFITISNKDLPVKKNGQKRKHHHVRKVALNNRNGRSIEERAEEIDTRKDYGHWEMDCVADSGRAALLVLTERSTHQEMIFKMKAKKQTCVIQVLDKLERKHKQNFTKIFKSITMDNGAEFVNQGGIENSCLKKNLLRTTCYYAHPYSSWERGSNEVNNKLIRRFIPKGSKIELFTAKEIKQIEHWMNHYPRRIFGYKTSNQMVLALLA